MILSGCGGGTGNSHERKWDWSVGAAVPSGDVNFRLRQPIAARAASDAQAAPTFPLAVVPRSDGGRAAT